MAQTVKNLPAMWETWVRSLSQEYPLLKGMATHSSVLAWRIPRTEEPGRLSSWGPMTLIKSRQCDSVNPEVGISDAQRCQLANPRLHSLSASLEDLNVPRCVYLWRR